MSAPATDTRARATASAAAGGLRLALAGGGTGGHVVPGLHLLGWARAQQGAPPPADLVWLLSGRPIEDEVLAGAGAELARVPLALEREGGGAPSRARLAWRTAPAVVRARRALREHASEVLLGLGGYASLPAVLAARSLGVPVALLEVNARPGAATRWLAPLADRVLHAWPASLPEHPQGPHGTGRRHVHVGPPLGPAFLGGAPGDAERCAARAALGLDPGHPVLLVLGGSQGAGPLNAFVRAHARLLVASGVQVLHQTGPGRLAEGCGELAGTQSVGYLARVDRALAAATLVLCRGGASTLFEVAALRAPAFVVPYAFHKDRHQEANARQLGLGVRVVSEEALGADLCGELVRLCRPDAAAERQAMAAALASAVPDGIEACGAARLYRELCTLAGREGSA